MINCQVVSSGIFSHNAAAKSLTAEISDTGIIRFERLYNDANDMGFELHNPKTGNTTRWALSTEHRDNEQDVTHWTFVPCPWTVLGNPAAKGYTLTLFND